jgi:hypothetical protein
MSVEAPQTADDAVVTGPPPGTEVWCPEGHGNRLLEVDDKWPLHCPVCNGEFQIEKPEAYGGGKTRKVDLPSVGRIVHILMAPDTVRPAIVMGNNEDGRILVTVFKHEQDPTPPGLATGVGVVPYGLGILGHWFWPAKSSEKFDTPDV